MSKHPIHYFTAIVVLLLAAQSCKKFVTIAPATEVDADVIFSGDEPANIALIGLYAKMVKEFGLMNGYPSLYGGQYADELEPLLPQPSDLPFFQNELNADERVVRGIWSTAYNQVNHANQTIEKIAQSEGMTGKGRQQLTAEAKFIRGIYYFYLVNLFGEVPLILTSRYQETQQAKRMPITQVYQQIEQDLQEAVAGLPETWPVYPNTGAVPIRATKFAAMTLLARVHLYRGNWQQAIQQCDAVMEAGKFKLAIDPNDAFRMSSPEIILGLQPTSIEYNTAEGHYFVYQPAIMPDGPAYVLTDSLVKAFEPTDKRFIAWAKPAMVENKRVYAPDNTRYMTESS
jgi:starch-binding outer membrane protein, SusD/RagB family